VVGVVVLKEVVRFEEIGDVSVSLSYLWLCPTLERKRVTK